MEFLLGVTVGAFACYVILREKINISGRKVLIVGTVVLALMFIGGLLIFQGVAMVHPLETQVEVIREEFWKWHPQQLPCPDCLQVDQESP